MKIVFVLFFLSTVLAFEHARPKSGDDDTHSRAKSSRRAARVEYDDDDEEDFDSAQAAYDYDDEDGSRVLNFVVEQSFDGVNFTPRGSVDVEFTSLQRKSTVTFSPSTFRGEEQDRLKALLKVNGFYYVRVSSDNTAAVVASVPVCHLVGSAFREQWVFNMDVYGNMISLNYNLKAKNPANKCVKKFPKTDGDLTIKSQGRISYGRIGERVRMAPVKKEEQGKPEENKSFFQKYWMYIGIFLLVMMFSGGK